MGLWITNLPYKQVYKSKKGQHMSDINVFNLGAPKSRDEAAGGLDMKG